MTLQEYIGRQIKTIRQQRGIKQHRLADQLGLPHQSLSRYERGRVLPNAIVLRKIARVLGVSVDVLIGTWDEAIDEEP